MSDATSLFNAAELALASFSALVNGATENQRAALTQATGAQMSLTQATEFARRYPTIVTQFNDRLDEDGMNTGFSVTVFSDLAGNLTVAFRGVNDLVPGTQSDLPASADIFGSGAAYDQIVAMVNWWNRASASSGQVPQFRLASYAPEAVPADAVVLRSDGVQSLVLESAAPAEAFTGGSNFSAALGARRMDVTGQSLGGHLSMAFSSLFASRTGQVTVFNSPGFINSTANQAFFNKLGGAVPTAAGNVVNVIADEALVGAPPFNIIAGLHSRPGQSVNISIENQWLSDEPIPFDSKNHSLEALTDSLAVYKLLADLDPTLRLRTGDYKAILNQAAMFTSASLERIVDGLESLFGINDTLLKTGNGNRESLYQAIYGDGTETNVGLLQNPTFTSRIGQLQIVRTVDNATTLLTQAQSAGTAGLAYRFALHELNPFVALDPNGTGLYARYQAGGTNAGELDNYDAATNPQGLTQSYLDDRAAFLERKLYITGLNRTQFYEDPSLSFGTTPNPLDARGQGYQFEAKDFQDRASGFIASDGSRNRNSQLHYIFGGPGTDVVEGAGREDRLYGGASGDILAGRFAADYLEGGRGFDTYRFSVNDGVDTILDSDGKGVIVRNGAVLALGVKDSDTQWSFGGTTFTKTTDGKDLEIAFGGGDKIAVKDFDFATAQQGKYLAIRLMDAPTTPQTTRTIEGDREPEEFTAAVPVGFTAEEDWRNIVIVETQHDGDGNPVSHTITYNRVDDIDNYLPGNADPNRVDDLNDSSGNDLIQLAGGDDIQDSAQGGDDRVHAGAGRDTITVGGGKDLIEGGAEGDVVIAGAGNDRVYGNAEIALANAIQAAETDAPQTETGDLIAGGDGDDILVASSAASLVLGGAGLDVIVGGAADDTIYGDGTVTTASLAWTIERAVTPQGATTRYEVTGQHLAFSIPGVASGAADSIYAGAGVDWIFAGAADDYIDTGNDNDVAFGEAGSDVLIGGAGNDVLSGDNAILVFGADEGADYLDGGAGEDELFGDGGDDILYGGADDDYLAGGVGADIIVGGPGRDTLFGGPGKDTYIFNRGDGREDIFDPSSGANASVLVFGEGIASGNIKLSLGSLLIDLGGGDALHFEGFDAIDPFSTPLIDSIQFADGSAMSYQDLLDLGFDIEGTEGDDTIDGTVVTDRVDAKGGNDNVSGRTGDDSIIGGAGNDLLLGEAGNDILSGGAGIDSLDGDWGDDVLAGDEGDDELFGGGGNDVLNGGAGDDRITGDSGDDALSGGAGNDVLIGSVGADVYIFSIGDGQDRIDEQGVLTVNLFDTASVDVMRFSEGIAPADVTLLARGNGDLIVRYGTDDQVTVKGQYRVPGNAIERIEFADGTVIEGSALNVPIMPVDGTAGDDVLYGTDGTDTLRGLAGNDVLDGGLSPQETATPVPLTDNDRLEGGAGADTYAMYLGMGADTIVDASGSLEEIGTLKLASGLTLESIRAQRRGEDLFVGLRSGDEGVVVAGYYSTGSPAQNWQVMTDDGTVTPIEDVINRPDPNADDIAAAALEDYKQSVLSNWSALSRSGQLPTHALVFNSWAQTVTRLTIDPNSSPQILVQPPVTQQFVTNYGVRQGGNFAPVFPFQTQVTPVFESQESDAPLIQTQGSPTSSQQGRVFGVTLGSVARNVSGSVTTNTTATNVNTVSTTVTSTNESWRSITLTPDPAPGFTPVFTVSQSVEERVIEEITGGDSNNQIQGALASNGDHVALIDAGGGDDIVQAGAYDFVYGNDGNDRVLGGHIVYGGNDGDLLIDGATQYGGAGDDTLIGGSFMAGGEGYDFHVGRAGATVFFFDPSDAGEDFVEDSAGVSPEDFADWYYGTIGIEHPDEHVEFAGMYVVGDMRDHTNDTMFRLAQVYGGTHDGLLGIVDPYAGNSDMDATAYHSLEDLRAELARFGIPYLPGEVRYIEPLPPLPVVTAIDYAALEPLYAAGLIELDVVEFGEGVSLDDLVVYFDLEGKLAISWNFDKVVHVTLPTATDFIGAGIERFKFADGTTISLAEMLERTGPRPLPTIFGTEDDDFLIGTLDSERIVGLGGDDTIDASEGDDVVEGGAGDDDLHGGFGEDQLEGGEGNDFLNGNEGNDALSGGEGADFLNGNDDNDTLEGGLGDDFVAGGTGDDTYVFEAGDGIDFVFDEDGTDAIRFGVGIAPESIGVTRDPYGRLYLVYGAGNRVGLEWLEGESPQIETVEFEDATVWDAAEIESRVATLSATEFSDVLTQTAGSDIADGLGGNDEIYGLGGDDALDGGTGDDYLEGNTGSDILRGSEGADDLADWQGDNLLDGGAGDDNLTADGAPNDPDGGANFVVGGGGSDWTWSFATGNVIAFNSGDGQDTVYALNALTLSLGGGIEPSSLSLSQDGDDLLLTIGTGDSIRLTRQFELDPQAWPQITLQMFGSVHLYDLSAVIADFQAALAADPSLTEFPLDAALQAHEISVSETDAFGGVLAYQYGTVGNLDALNDTAIRQALADADFGAAPQAIELPGGNQVPVLSELLEDQTAQEDTLFTFFLPQGTFSDPGDSLSFSASGLPAWLAFGPGVFSGTPENADVRAFEVTVTATDSGGLTASDTFTLTVQNTNDAPGLEIPIADRSATVGTEFSHVVAGAFTDIDQGDELTFSATAANGDPLPAWLTFDAVAGAFAGTPGPSDIAEISVFVTATDRAGASATDDFRLTVTDDSEDHGVHLVGTDQIDTLTGTEFEDVLEGLGGSDGLFGLGGDDLLSGGRGRDQLFGDDGQDVLHGERGRDMLHGGTGDDFLDGGGAKDWLFGEAGNDVLAGGRGDDQLRGGAGSDVYIYELNGGNDALEEAGPEADTLLLGEGITPGMAKLERHRDDLIVELRGRDGSVTVKGWFTSSSKRVETIRFADGTTWGVEEIRDRARRGGHGGDWHGDDDHGYHHSNHDDDRHGDEDGRKHNDSDGDVSERKRDSVADLLAVYFADKPRYDFESFGQELGTSNGYGEALGPREIARRWHLVARYGAGLANEHDDEGRSGAVLRLDAYGLLGGGASGGGFGYAGSTGATRGAANLQTFNGLEEGFQRLHS